MTATQLALVDVPAPPARDVEAEQREAMRRHLASRPLLAADPRLVTSAVGALRIDAAPLPRLCNTGRSLYTQPVDERTATRRQLAAARHRPHLRTLHRACLLLDAHGDWARAELSRQRSDGTARVWGVDLDHVDDLLARAGVPAAGAQAEMFGEAASAPVWQTPPTLDDLTASERVLLLAWPVERWSGRRPVPERGHDPAARRWGPSDEPVAIHGAEEVERLASLGVVTAEPRGGYRLTEAGASMWRALRAEMFGREGRR